MPVIPALEKLRQEDTVQDQPPKTKQNKRKQNGRHQDTNLKLVKNLNCYNK
jgi:hypothetical protein